MTLIWISLVVTFVAVIALTLILGRRGFPAQRDTDDDHA